MSIHRSLKIRGGLTRARNVLTRVERIEKLRKDKRLGEGASVFGLPKVKVVVLKPKRKEKKAADEGEAGAAPATAGARDPGSAEPGAEPAK